LDGCPGEEHSLLFQNPWLFMEKTIK